MTLPGSDGLIVLEAREVEQGEHRVKLTVAEIDEKTETLRIVIEGDAIDFERIHDAINDSGASLHSIDEVEVENGPEPPV